MTQIVIMLDSNGKIHTTGPIQNKILCLGMLEMAKDAILKYDPSQQPMILPVSTNGVPK